MLVSRADWFFIVIAFFLATTASSKQVYGVDPQRKWPSFARGRGSPMGAELEQKLPKGTVGKSVYQNPPKQAPLNGPSNETEFTGKRINSEIVSDSKQYSKNPTEVTLNFHPFPQERTQDVVKKTFKGPTKIVPQLLLNNAYSLEIRSGLYGTKFVKDMFTGTLDPDNYARFKVQNIVYLDHVAKMYNLAGDKMQIQGKEDWVKFYFAQSMKHQELYEHLRLTYGIEGAESVEKGPAVKLYMNYLEVVANDRPKYLAIAMLPCSTYWSLIADDLHEDKQQMNAFKRKWIEDNKRPPGHLGSTAEFVANHYTEEEDFKPGLFHFCKASVAEVNTFQEAGGEPLTQYLDILEACSKL